jgi:hypothetical protein
MPTTISPLRSADPGSVTSTRSLSIFTLLAAPPSAICNSSVKPTSRGPAGALDSCNVARSVPIAISAATTSAIQRAFLGSAFVTRAIQECCFIQ